MAEMLTDQIVCNCLQITESEIRGALSTGAVETLNCIKECTGAGTGCTACHRRIAALMAEHKAQCSGASSSPICIAR